MEGEELINTIKAGDLVSLISRNEKLFQAQKPRRRNCWGLVESDLDFDPNSSVPLDSVLVILKTEDSNYIGFRSLVADGKVLQSGRDRDLKLQFENHNFGSWEQWKIVKENGPDILLSNRQFPDKQFSVTIKFISILHDEQKNNPQNKLQIEEKKVLSFEETHSRCRAELSKLRSNLADSKNEILNLNREVEGWRSRNNALNDKLLVSEKCLSEMKLESLKSHKSLEHQILSLQKEMQKTEEDMKLFQLEIEKSAQNAAEEQIYLERSRMQNYYEEKFAEDMKMREKMYTKVVKENEDYKEKFEKLQAENENLKNEVEKAEMEKTTLKEEYEKVLEEKKELDQIYESVLDEKIQTIRNEIYVDAQKWAEKKVEISEKNMESALDKFLKERNTFWIRKNEQISVEKVLDHEVGSGLKDENKDCRSYYHEGMEKEQETKLIETMMDGGKETEVDNRHCSTLKETTQNKSVSKILDGDADRDEKDEECKKGSKTNNFMDNIYGKSVPAFIRDGSNARNMELPSERKWKSILKTLISFTLLNNDPFYFSNKYTKNHASNKCGIPEVQTTPKSEYDTLINKYGLTNSISNKFYEFDIRKIYLFWENRQNELESIDGNQINKAEWNEKELGLFYEEKVLPFIEKSLWENSLHRKADDHFPEKEVENEKRVLEEVITKELKFFFERNFSLIQRLDVEQCKSQTEEINEMCKNITETEPRNEKIEEKERCEERVFYQETIELQVNKDNEEKKEDSEKVESKDPKTYDDNEEMFEKNTFQTKDLDEKVKETKENYHNRKHAAEESDDAQSVWDEEDAIMNNLPSVFLSLMEFKLRSYFPSINHIVESKWKNLEDECVNSGLEFVNKVMNNEHFKSNEKEDREHNKNTRGMNKGDEKCNGEEVANQSGDSRNETFVNLVSSTWAESKTSHGKVLDEPSLGLDSTKEDIFDAKREALEESNLLLLNLLKNEILEEELIRAYFVIEDINETMIKKSRKLESTAKQITFLEKLSVRLSEKYVFVKRKARNAVKMLDRKEKKIVFLIKEVEKYQSRNLSLTKSVLLYENEISNLKIKSENLQKVLSSSEIKINHLHKLLQELKSKKSKRFPTLFVFLKRNNRTAGRNKLNEKRNHRDDEPISDNKNEENENKENDDGYRNQQKEEGKLDKPDNILCAETANNTNTTNMDVLESDGGISRGGKSDGEEFKSPSNSNQDYVSKLEKKISSFCLRAQSAENDALNFCLLAKNTQIELLDSQEKVKRLEEEIQNLQKLNKLSGVSRRLIFSEDEGKGKLKNDDGSSSLNTEIETEEETSGRKKGPSELGEKEPKDHVDPEKSLIMGKEIDTHLEIWDGQGKQMQNAMSPKMENKSWSSSPKVEDTKKYSPRPLYAHQPTIEYESS